MISCTGIGHGLSHVCCTSPTCSARGLEDKTTLVLTHRRGLSGFTGTLAPHEALHRWGPMLRRSAHGRAGVPGRRGAGRLGAAARCEAAPQPGRCCTAASCHLPARHRCTALGAKTLQPWTLSPLVNVEVPEVSKSGASRFAQMKGARLQCVILPRRDVDQAAGS